MQGLKVVAIDARDAPLQLAETQRLSPDLAINAIKTTPQETLRRIDAMRPDGWDQGSGVDGESQLVMLKDLFNGAWFPYTPLHPCLPGYYSDPLPTSLHHSYGPRWS